MSLTLADAIERHILAQLAVAGEIAVQRVELARQYGCAPSQINYVLATRFTPERGFLTESRRGGGGYIRVRRAAQPELSRIAAALRAQPDGIAQAPAHALIARCRDAGLLTGREAAMLQALTRREAIGLPLPARDVVRARCLASALLALSDEG